MISVDGLVSGFDTTKIINEMLDIKQKPIELLDARIEDKKAKETGYQTIMAKLLGLQQTANKLGSEDLFSKVQVSSSNESAILASGSSDLNQGSYSFRVAQLARTGQFTSNGFATQDETPVGAGTLSIEIGRSSLGQKTKLEELNGGSGIERGKIRISDRSGSTGIIDISSALTIQDVVDAINNNSDVSVTARIAESGDTSEGEGIVLTDNSGGTGDLSVQEVGSGNTARDLGIRNSVSASTLEGSDIVNISERTHLSILNDGNGVVLQAGNDLQITQKNGNSFFVDLGSASTVGEVITAINNAAGNEGVTVSIDTGGNNLLITDSTAASGTTTISEPGTGTTARDLGITGSFTTASNSGDRLLAGINTSLVRELKGGSGISPGSISITDRAGNTTTIDLSAAETVTEIINTINSTALTDGVSIEASLNRAGDGLRIKDTSNGSNNLYVNESGGGSTASDLGILNASGVASDEIDGEDLYLQYISKNTLLNTLNGGKGVYAGSIKITDRNGISFNVNLAQEENIDDVLSDINGAASASSSDLTATINSQGNGILINSPTGSGTLTIEEVGGGTTAADLGIAGSGTSGEIDGSFEHTITISDTATLEDVKDAINNLDLQLNVSIINDGSTGAPYRFFVNGKNGGELGEIMIHTRGTNLTFQRASEAQDAVVMSGNSTNPLIVRSSSNSFKDIIPGLNMTVMSKTNSPVQITVTPDNENLMETISKFTDDYNEIVDSINAQTGFDTDTEESGMFLGDSTIMNILRELSYNFTRAIQGNPSGMNMAANVGLHLGPRNKLIFKQSEFSEKLLTNRDLVKSLFTAKKQIEASTSLSIFRNGEGVRTVTGKDDFQIHTRDGNTFNVDMGSSQTVQQVLNAINDATGNNSVTAAISSDGHSFVLEDSSTGSTTFRVTALNSSSAYNDLGINKSADLPGSNKITGYPIDVTGDWGLGKQLFETLDKIVNVDTGTLQLGTEGLGKRIDDLNERKKDMQETLDREEARLRQTFAQLEVIMGQQQNMLQQLTATMGGLSSSK